MMNLNTYIHLGILYANKMHIEDPSFILGISYKDLNKKYKYHYRTNHFTRGFHFYSFIKKNYSETLLDDFSIYDYLILDMEAIGSEIQSLKELDLKGVKDDARKHILELANQPMPLYLVSEDKKEIYLDYLNQIIQNYIENGQE